MLYQCNRRPQISTISEEPRGKDRQIILLENQLSRGYYLRRTILGKSEVVNLTKGRRQMLELKLKQLKGCEVVLWLGGTYEYHLHGELKSGKQ